MFAGCTNQIRQKLASEDLVDNAIARIVLLDL